MLSPWENQQFALKSLEHIDEKFLPGTSNEVQFIKEELGLSIGDSVVDLGCGAGRHTIELAKLGVNVVGIDISSTMINYARKRSEQANVTPEFIIGDLRHLKEIIQQFRSLFKGAICLCESGFGVLGQHDDLKFLKDVNDLLLPGAKFIITTFNGIRKYRQMTGKLDEFNYLTGISNWQTPDDWEGSEKLKETDRFYIPSEISLLLKITGFDKIKFYGCSPGNFNKQKLDPDDIELMVIGEKTKSKGLDC